MGQVACPALLALARSYWYFNSQTTGFKLYVTRKRERERERAGQGRWKGGVRGRGGGREREGGKGNEECEGLTTQEK